MEQFAAIETQPSVGARVMEAARTVCTSGVEMFNKVVASVSNLTVKEVFETLFALGYSKVAEVDPIIGKDVAMYVSNSPVLEVLLAKLRNQ